MLDRYLEFKIFEFFRDRLTSVINTYRSSETQSEENFYKHIFLAPESYSATKSFQVNGVLTPYVCLWATSPLQFNSEFYGKSVLPRNISYTDASGAVVMQRAFVYELQKDFEFVASSYFKSFVGDINQQLIELDRIRFFDLDMSELLYNFTSRIVLELTGLVMKDQVDESSDNRAFTLNAKYRVKVTMPLKCDYSYVNSLKVYLNSKIIYELVK
jgi:hypothetical protein